MSEGIRLNKALADAGVCSRRRADELVFAGRVGINGVPAESPGQRVLPGDVVSVDGRTVTLKDERADSCWLMLNKPVRVVSTASDPEGRETVLDLVPEPWNRRRLFPVGRLDFFSEGLLLVTDDGELAHRLTHPRWHLSKVYQVLVRPERGESSVSAALSLMRRGMTLAEGDRLAPVEVNVLSSSGRGVLLEMVLHQGLNRQIRRMCRDVGFTVLRLKRVKEGPLELGSLAPGRVRPLSDAEVSALRRAVGLGKEPEESADDRKQRFSSPGARRERRRPHS
ncbi:pseudouridine synthase [uncultured Mailhella sp.]|uniref:pseudouridine synthase n=1 Tax=uncultured Mailhella sp. TaxID=1981031 RepID=UPI0025E9DD4C|nr:pseudouridine synthase [uncultured Mailhella sp.]